MDKFDILNRRTWEYNNLRPVDPYKISTSQYTYFNPCKQNLLNSQTYKQNNGQHSRFY